MVDGHPVVHLILSPGDQVTACGVLQFTGEDRAQLWVVAPWNPSRPGRVAGGEVGIQLDQGPSRVAGAITRVIGTWADGRIVKAKATREIAPDAGCGLHSTNLMSPRDLGTERCVDLLNSLRSFSPAPVLGSGGSESALSISVLFVTSQLVDALVQLPVSCELYASIFPSALMTRS